jgi:FRG domain
MQGQWIGLYSGSNSGQVLVDCDRLTDHYEGYAIVADSKPGNPSSFVEFSTPDLSSKFTMRLAVRVIDPSSAEPGDWNRIAPQFPGITFPAYADAEFELLGGGQLKLEWRTDIGTFGNALLSPSHASQPPFTQLLANISNWRQFREYVRELKPHEFIFRGQQDNRWRLRTGFHRTGRINLARYYRQDVQTLWRHFSAIVPHHFDLDNSHQYGAFVSLAQHHGFPTPLLDWTYSPFVAAYFAFRGLRNSVVRTEPPGRNVRIFMFNKSEWTKTFLQVPKLAPLPPHFTIIEALAIANPRMIPQQALVSLTNIDDIEGYIRWAETLCGKSFLHVIDLPVQDRPDVMSELSLMGVAAGSLLPGLDGTCEELKERFYDL